MRGTPRLNSLMSHRFCRFSQNRRFLCSSLFSHPCRQRPQQTQNCKLLHELANQQTCTKEPVILSDLCQYFGEYYDLAKLIKVDCILKLLFGRNYHQLSVVKVAIKRKIVHLNYQLTFLLHYGPENTGKPWVNLTSDSSSNLSSFLMKTFPKYKQNISLTRLTRQILRMLYCKSSCQ